MRHLLFFMLLSMSMGCNAQTHPKNDMSNEPQYTNALINESSPYLQQHAHNPVNWYPWGPTAFEKAKRENKLVLVSIGYSSCHWCHVMEHESFEDTTVARIMNENFVCIKVDREERPDVDQIYMTAVQLQTGRGGWPLNCFTLPDGKPVWGGTYFYKDQLIDILTKLSQGYKSSPQDFYNRAQQLTMDIVNVEFIGLDDQALLSRDLLTTMVSSWVPNFDEKEGGPNRSPKFPLPNNYEFLMRYAYQMDKSSINNHVRLTLDKMCRGGIYDQIGGGFARYSVDANWKIPHFEKMLYDNAQLISLYSLGYKNYGVEEYKMVVEETIEWLDREMKDPAGAYYSALDADSEGEEGKFYVWTADELKKILGSKDFERVQKMYNINAKGLWEEGKYVLLRDRGYNEIATQLNLTLVDFLQWKRKVDEKLLKARSKRVRPGLDNKVLTSWNGLLLEGMVNAYSATKNKDYLEKAIGIHSFMQEKMLQPDGGLYRTYANGESKLQGYLDDYAAYISGLIALYQVTFDDAYILEAKRLSEYAIAHFDDETTQMFFYTSDQGEQLIARKSQVDDDVIPSSNSMMARNLYKLGLYFGDRTYIERATQMGKNMSSLIRQYGSGYSNWAMLFMDITFPYFELAISGDDALENKMSFNASYIPNVIFAGGNSSIPLMTGRIADGLSNYYVCVGNTCQLPTMDAQKAKSQILKR